jgi:hypothetical protein
MLIRIDVRNRQKELYHCVRVNNNEAEVNVVETRLGWLKLYWVMKFSICLYYIFFAILWTTIYT